MAEDVHSSIGERKSERFVQGKYSTPLHDLTPTNLPTNQQDNIRSLLKNGDVSTPTLSLQKKLLL